MSQDDDSPTRAADEGVAPAPVAAARPDPGTAGAHRTRLRTPHRPRPSGRGGAIALALLLALLAILLAGYIAWRQWQQAQVGIGDHHAVTAMQQQVGALQGAVDDLTGERSQLRERLDDASQVNRSLREEVLGQSERLRDLEGAVAKLSQKSLSGQDTMRLDETEALLRMGQQRYVLFHDARGAATAYALAEQSLAAVEDDAFSGLHQSIEAEREALARSQPATHAAELATMQQLREGIDSLPLKPAGRPASAAPQDAWTRVGHALASVISVQRDRGAPLDVTDARLARELVALDLAQAESAVLAWDNGAAAGALRRADARLAAQFDAGASKVRQARRQIGKLLGSLQPATPVKLGAALSELRNLRAVHALQPNEPSPAPGAGKPHAAPAGGRP